MKEFKYLSVWLNSEGQMEVRSADDLVNSDADTVVVQGPEDSPADVLSKPHR